MSRKDDRTREEAAYYDYVKKLQEKYGIPSGPYYVAAKTSGRLRKNSKISRTKEGLYIHHIEELSFPILSSPFMASRLPQELQKPEALAYCSIFEHLMAHILITEAAISNPYGYMNGVGQGGINLMVANLNDWYAGFPPKESSWEYPTWEMIKDRKSEYKALLKRAQKNLCSQGKKGKLKDLSARKRWSSC